LIFIAPQAAPGDVAAPAATAAPAAAGPASRAGSRGTYDGTYVCSSPRGAAEPQGDRAHSKTAPAAAPVGSAGPWSDISAFTSDLCGDTPYATFEVWLGGVHKLGEGVTCYFTESSFDLKVCGLGGQNYRFRKCNLGFGVVAAGSAVLVEEDRVILALQTVTGDRRGDAGTEMWPRAMLQRPLPRAAVAAFTALRGRTRALGVPGGPELAPAAGSQGTYDETYSCPSPSGAAESLDNCAYAKATPAAAQAAAAAVSAASATSVPAAPAAPAATAAPAAAVSASQAAAVTTGRAPQAAPPPDVGARVVAAPASDDGAASAAAGSHGAYDRTYVCSSPRGAAEPLGSRAAQAAPAPTQRGGGKRRARRARAESPAAAGVSRTGAAAAAAKAL